MAEERPSVRAVLGGVAFRTGLLVGLATVAVAGFVVFLLSLISWDPLSTALGVEFSGESPPTQARIARSALFPWLGQTNIDATDLHVTNRGLIPLPWLVLLGTLAVAGIVVRRRIAATGRDRLVALGAATVAVLLVLALVAATLSWEQDFGGPEPAEYTFSPWWYLLVGAAQMLVVGAFAFGVVGTWRPSLRVPARTAGVVVGAVVLAGILVFPAFVVAGSPSAGEGQRAIALDFAQASAWGPGASSATIPLAVGAKAHLEASASLTPFTTGSTTYWPQLQRYALEHSSARINGYAGADGAVWAGAVWFGAVVLLVLWIVAALQVAQALGASTARDGLRHGATLGAFAAILLAVFASFAGLVAVAKSASLGVDDDYYWGMTAGGLAQTAIGLIILTGVTGLVYGFVRQRRA